MKIKLISDVHLEFGYLDVEQDNADVLVIAGDLLVVEDLYDIPLYVQEQRLIDHNLSSRLLQVKEFRKFLDQVSKKFKHVVYVMGNHEFYDGRLTGSIEHLRYELENFPNIHLLECESITIEDTTFIGGTLWTDFNKIDSLSMYDAKQFMNDYKVIRYQEGNHYRKLRPLDTLRRHQQTVHYFLNTLKELTNKVVVVTHHAPTFKSIHEMYGSETTLNGSYASDLSELILDYPNIKYWFHGHVHHYNDYQVGNCRVMSNPRGYFMHNGYENTGFNPNLILEV